MWLRTQLTKWQGPATTASKGDYKTEALKLKETHNLLEDEIKRPFIE